MFRWITSRDRAELVDMLRMWPTLVIALVTLGIIHAIAPQQTAIIVYKVCSLSLAAYLGYWVDRWVFRESRPGAVEGTSREIAAELRRAAIIVGAMIASALMF